MLPPAGISVFCHVYEVAAFPFIFASFQATMESSPTNLNPVHRQPVLRASRTFFRYSGKTEDFLMIISYEGACVRPLIALFLDFAD
jgi:hypothetical protein